MPQSPAARLVLLGTAFLAVLGAFAGASAGSATAPLRATAPRLIAHDTSAFFPVLSHARPRLVAPHLRPADIAKRTARRGRTLFGGVTSLLENFAAPAPSGGTAPGGSYTTGDIGRTQYLEAVDGTYVIYSRVGGYLASVSNKAFWSGIGGSDAAGLCATNPSNQPVIAYDRGADRWVVSEAGYSSGSWVQCFALSTSGDATGTWDRYVFAVSSTVHPDMPSIGIWPDGYYLAFNQQSSSGWAGGGALVVDRQAMLAHPGSDPRARYFNLQNLSPGLGGFRVATQESVSSPSAGSPALYAQMYDDPLNANDRLELWGFHVDWSAPATGSTFTRLTSIAVPSYTTDPGDVAFSDPAASPPLNYTLPQLGAELEYYNDGAGTQTLTVTDSIKWVDSNGNPTNALGWYQLANSGSGWSLSSHGPSTDYGVEDAPVAAFDGLNIAAGFVLRNPGGSPVLAYADATDGTIATQQITTTASVKSMALTLDPVADCTFWMSGPSVAQFSFSNCATTTSHAPVLTGDPQWAPGLVQEGTATATATPGSFSGATTTVDQWLLCDLNGLNCTTIAGANSTTYIPVRSDADGTHTLRFAETASNAYGSSTAVSSPAAPIESIPPASTAAPVITGTAETGATLSVDNGSWTSSSPPSFTYRWERCTAGTCSQIPGAASSTYVPTTDDVGTTLEAIVSATNTGGGADATSAPTATVIVAPPGSTTSTTTTTTTTTTSTTTTSTGTTTENPPDLALTVSSSPASPAVGDRVTLYYTVTDKNKQPARSLQVTLTLPQGLTYAGAYAERGPGCVASTATKVVCSLDYVSALTPVTRVQVYLTVNASTAETVSATATSSPADSSPSDNTVSTVVGSGSAAPSNVIGSTTLAPILGPDGAPLGLNGLTSKSASGVDRTAPTAQALRSTGRRGSAAALKFRIYDNSGVARAAATVARNGHVVATVSTGFGPVADGTVYFVAWRVPAQAAKGTYSFCVVAGDRAKHSSKQSCAPLTVR